MGLDMYLNAEKYVSEYSNRELSIELDNTAKKFLPLTEGKRVNHLTFEFAYWRKANQIHGWFVSNIQNDVDNCERYYVSQEGLVELYNLCNEVLKTKNKEDAMDELPPCSGFFFGSTEIDESYWQDLELTVKQLQPIIDNPEEWGEFDFYYQSSW